jgi:hypothetical protein
LGEITLNEIIVSPCIRQHERPRAAATRETKDRRAP